MPENIGHYEVERVLGSGAFATVWLAHDERLDAQVAIKVLAENWAHDVNVRDRFAEEARVLWRLDSDRAIRVHLVDELDDGRPYFVMDYADRGSLADRMAKRASTGSQYSIDDAIATAIEIADALAVVHRLGVVHRDLKPSNVLYRSIASHHGDTRTERMVLADFGVARALDAATAFTIAAGTPHYMAPEQSEGRADERSDVYAAGVLLYELLAGRVPYPYESVGAVMRAQLTEVPAPISSVRDDAPASLDAVLARALAAEPDQRYASASEWADALRRVQSGDAEAPVVGPVDTGTAETIIRPAGVAGVAGVAAGAASVGAGSAAAGGGAAPPPGPPPVPAATPPTPPSGGSGGGSKRRRNTVIAAVMVVVLIAAVVGVAVLSSGDEATAGEIFLDPRDGTRVGDNDPFAPPSIDPNVVVPKVLATNPNAVPPPAPVGGAIPSTSGAEPGLYGGTRDSSVCDPTKLITFLQENSAKAKAWANTLGVAVADIPTYVSSLTSVLLRADTRVTNHGFANGNATAVQSVLEAGTAVLVDHFGVPRVKCYCGNPLVEPEPVKSDPSYRGPQWRGFQPAVVQVVTPAPQPVTVIVIVDVKTGEPFGRPVGTDGGNDVNATLPPRDGTSTTTTAPTTSTSPATTTQPAGGNSDVAIKLVHDALQRCIDKVAADEGLSTAAGAADTLGYSATSLGAGAFDVLVTAANNGPERGTWRVDTRTGDLVPRDQTASEVGGQCPELA